MTKFMRAVICRLIVFQWVSIALSATAHAGAPSLIPAPWKLETLSGDFRLTDHTRICTDWASGETGEALAQALRKSTGYPLKVEKKDFSPKPTKDTIVLTTYGSNPKLGDEGYELTATPDSVVIRASRQAGMFYGTRTLLELLPPAVFSSNVVRNVTWRLPCVRIEDKPRFKWRGLMLDVSRHFFTKPQVERLLDLMALHKLNTFQWHLTDDQGWRIEIKKYPRLTEVGAWRTNCDLLHKPPGAKIPGIHREWMKPPAAVFGPDGRYGGYYTQEDIREVVAYAAARHITIIPEIEMPGHSCAALAAYPQFSCFGGPFTTDAQAGVIHDGVYCPGNDQTFALLEGVLSEVFALFPTKYIHIGGDEVEKDTWKKCPKCQALMRREGLNNEKQLQSYFIKRIGRFVSAHGHTLIGWSEIMEGGLASNAVVMDWKGGGREAAIEGHDVVMTPIGHCYFDRLQSADRSQEPYAGGYLPLRRVYDFEPIPKGLPPQDDSHILGTQANVWTGSITSPAELDYMTFPRLCALAEVAWSPKGAHNWKDFQRRLRVQELRLAELGVNYRKDRYIKLGEWSPANLTDGQATLKWDVPHDFKGKGTCHVVFDYLGGSRALKITTVGLLKNGKIISQDRHAGLAGGRPSNAAYFLTLPARDPSAQYQIEAVVQGKGGSDSFGSVLWIEEPGN